MSSIKLMNGKTSLRLVNIYIPHGEDNKHWINEAKTS